jgi:prevent-host-death family protein
MTQTNIHEAKTQLSRLIRQALGGEEVVIAKGGEPVVKLTPLRKPPAGRRLGGWKGAFSMADDFDAELADFDDYVPR